MSLTSEDLAAIKNLLQPMNDKLDKLEERFDKLEARMDKLEERFDKLEEKVDSIDNRLLKFELHFENVTDQNIRLLAENHVALINKLNGTLQYHDDSTMYKVKVNFLTDEVEKLKQEIAEIKSKIA